MPLRSLIPCLLTPLVVGGCTAPAVEPDLSSSRTAARIPALVEAAAPIGQREDADPAALVARLDDPDPAVRLFAIGGLQRLTDERFGYRWYRAAEGRRDAVEAWRAWLATQREQPGN